MRHRPVVLTTITTVGLAVALLAPAGAVASDPAEQGQFTDAFFEPVIYDGGTAVETDQDCITSTDDQGRAFENCKPAAGSLAILPDGRMLYWNALEGTENVSYGIATEYGRVSINDQSRVLDFDTMTWARPDPLRADVGGGQATTLLPRGMADDSELGHNDNALFCTDLVHLTDGTVLVAGGTNYYNEPGNTSIPDHSQNGGGPYGVVELEGQTTSRVFDSATDTWRQAGAMAYGRWYPSLVTLADGRVLTSSGVTKLMKPLYPDPQRERADGPGTGDSGRNVTQVEVYDPTSQTWELQPETADRSLPLYPRLHLLPNGDVFYNASGQVYNPQGQAYDQALWNLAASYDPDTQGWTDLGVPGLDDPAAALYAGFRGSTFSMMLPLRPDDDGRYTRAQLLQAGGIVGTTPGTYVAVDHSRIVTVDVDVDEQTMSTRSTGPLNARRWYGTAVVLPTGEVFVANGSDGDEVVGPGSAQPVDTTEIFDPETETWRATAVQPRSRAYHNTATLLPDGRVLLGGHAPISGLYGANGGYAGNPNEDGRIIDTPVYRSSRNDGREPVFDIYEPPYLHRGERPVIRGVNLSSVTHGDRLRVNVAGDVDELMLIRNTALTHEVDADQRAVVLPIHRTAGPNVFASIPDQPGVVPNGPYMLFALADGVPSVSVPVLVTNHATAEAATSAITGADGSWLDTELATGVGTPEPTAAATTDQHADAPVPVQASPASTSPVPVQASPASTSTVPVPLGARWLAAVLVVVAGASCMASRRWLSR
ncbi:MAG TPA: galactose oxidase-like domain-containing protein [Nitriliruptorales bacterium]